MPVAPLAPLEQDTQMTVAGFSRRAVECLAEDDSCIFLQRERGLVYATHTVDDDARAAFQRDGVIQIKGVLDAGIIEEVTRRVLRGCR